eukprot:COSAG02_NODE_2529_length_8602_cov_20.688463_2_plen_281_part_00
MRATTEQTFWDKVGRPFTMTLTPGAWGWALATICVTCISMVCIEGAEVGDSADTILRELQQKDRYHSDDRRVDDHESNGEPDARCCKRWTCKKHCRAMGVSAYYGFLGLTGVSPKHEAHEAAGMLVIFGFGIFVLLFVSSYTGATAAILISESGRSVTINSMKDLQASGGKICIMAAHKTPFELRYPEFGGKLIPQRLADGVLQDFDDGRCEAAVLFSDGWDNALAGRIRICHALLLCGVHGMYAVLTPGKGAGGGGLMPGVTSTRRFYTFFTHFSLSRH